MQVGGWRTSRKEYMALFKTLPPPTNDLLPSLMVEVCLVLAPDVNCCLNSRKQGLLCWRSLSFFLSFCGVVFHRPSMRLCFHVSCVAFKALSTAYSQDDSSKSFGYPFTFSSNVSSSTTPVTGLLPGACNLTYNQYY